MVIQMQSPNLHRISLLILFVCQYYTYTISEIRCGLGLWIYFEVLPSNLKLVVIADSRYSQFCFLVTGTKLYLNYSNWDLSLLRNECILT